MAKKRVPCPCREKKRKLTKELWLDYFCKECLKLAQGQIAKIAKELQEAIPAFDELIRQSLLSKNRTGGLPRNSS